jgi:hypothetical protein
MCKGLWDTWENQFMALCKVEFCNMSTWLYIKLADWLYAKFSNTTFKKKLVISS